jgi:hypothetical protein
MRLPFRVGEAQRYIAEKVIDLGARRREFRSPRPRDADIVFLAAPWGAVEHALSGLPAWNNRILIGITNPFAKAVPAYVMEELDGRSASTIVADFASGPCFVKALNTILMTTAKKVQRKMACALSCLRPKTTLRQGTRYRV